jgi:hypothetical protein
MKWIWKLRNDNNELLQKEWTNVNHTNRNRININYHQDLIVRAYLQLWNTYFLYHLFS